MIFDKPIEAEDDQAGEVDEIIKETSRRFVKVMEKYIRAYPEQWLVFRKFWETAAASHVL